MKIALLLTAVLAIAQAPPPRFDVASIHQNTSGETTEWWTPPALAGRGEAAIVNTQLRRIIAQAYDISPFMEPFSLVGGPDDVLSKHFDIRAKPEAQATRAQGLLMLRTLLAERFALKIHTENRRMPVYVLTVLHAGKIGPDMRPVATDCAAWQKTRQTNPRAEEPRDVNGDRACGRPYDFGSTMKMRWAGPASDLASRLQNWVDRPVLDATGLTGSFDWVFSFARDNAANSDAPTIFQAVQDRLGLKLESRTEPRDVFVIDSVQMPTAD